MKRLYTGLLEGLVGLALIAVILWFLITQPLIYTVPNTTPSSISAERLQAHVKTLSAELPPRTYPANLDLAAAYIKTQLQAFGTVTEQTYPVDGETYRNLSLSLGPTSAKRIVIGAHYDAYNERPGADDNASGVAGLIELARFLRTQPLTQQVELVAYTLEEPPFYQGREMGSYHHAQSLRAANTGVEFMISLEMIGYFNDAPKGQTFPFAGMDYIYPDQGNFIAIVGHLGSMLLVRQVKSSMKSAMSLPVYSINAPTFVPGIDFSDHKNYWMAGYPAVMITDTAFYRNQAYHKTTDTWERLDYAKMAQVVWGVATVVTDQATKPQ